MRKKLFPFVLLLCVPAIEVSCSKPPETQPVKAVETVAPACAMPSSAAGSNEQTAWQLFVAASCPAKNEQLTWEKWTEQTCFLEPNTPGCGPTQTMAATAPVRHLHGSALGEHLRRRGLKPMAAAAGPGGCNEMTTAATASPAMKPFVPKNLGSSPQFCEEVFTDPQETAFVKAPVAGATLTNLQSQVAFAGATGVSFPTPSLEVKADWLPAASVNNAFDCAAKRPEGVYVETIDNACYALVGIHISSKLLPNWLWATFEPQNSVTNPNRCNPDLYNACNDPWGSDPAMSKGAATAPTAALADLMKRAGLAKELLNYRLVAAQTEFTDASGNAVQLGNSFTEFNAGVEPHQASCMTCHAYALVSTTGNENPNFGNFPGGPTIGKPGTAPLPAQGGGTWVSQDFSWMLGIMPAK
jgi:hypothetical protein